MRAEHWELLQMMELLQLDLSARLEWLFARGLTIFQAMELMVDFGPKSGLTRSMELAALGARVVQVKAHLLPGVASALGRNGIHPLSIVNWDGWHPQEALQILVQGWMGPGEAPRSLAGFSGALCPKTTWLPTGLQLKALDLVGGMKLKELPPGLQVAGDLSLVDLGLRALPDGLCCRGDLVLSNLHHLKVWGEGIRVGGDLVIEGTKVPLQHTVEVGGSVRHVATVHPFRGFV